MRMLPKGIYICFTIIIFWGPSLHKLNYFSLKRILSLILSILIVSLTPVLAGQYSLSYDDNGNLVSDETNYYEYNSLNQLSKVRKSSSSGDIIAEFFYDFDGARIKKIEYENGKATTTYYLGSNYVRVVSEGGTQEYIYIYHDGVLVAEQHNGVKTYYHPNHLGSTDIVTDASGNVLQRNEYLPFGEPLTEVESRFSFTGKEEDEKTGLLYFGSRYYSSELRQFTQPDTIQPDIYDPQQLNKYSYARNNPLKYTDPTGHWLHIAVGALIGAAIGAVASVVVSVVKKEPVKLGNVLKSAAVGAVAGAVGAATFGLAYAGAGAVGIGTGTAAYATAGAVGAVSAGRAAQFTSNAINHRPLGADMLEPVPIIRDAVIGAATAGIGSRFIKPAASSQGSKTIKYVDPKDLKPVHPVQIDKVKNIRQSIVKNGYDNSQPVKVVTYKNNVKVIADGHHRTRAAIASGQKKIPVIEAKPGEFPRWDIGAGREATKSELMTEAIRYQNYLRKQGLR